MIGYRGLSNKRKCAISNSYTNAIMNPIMAVYTITLFHPLYCIAVSQSLQEVIMISAQTDKCGQRVHRGRKVANDRHESSEQS